MKIAIIAVVVVLLLCDQNEARRGKGHGGGRRGHGGGRRRGCIAKTEAKIPPCWTGKVFCPANSRIQIDSVQCKEMCTRSRPGACTDTTLQTTIETACNGNTECSVNGVTGTTCADLKTVVYVDWSCNSTTTVTIS